MIGFNYALGRGVIRSVRDTTLIRSRNSLFFARESREPRRRKTLAMIPQLPRLIAYILIQLAVSVSSRIF